MTSRGHLTYDARFVLPSGGWVQLRLEGNGTPDEYRLLGNITATVEEWQQAVAHRVAEALARIFGVSA